MTEDRPPTKRPLLGLVVVALVFLIPIGAALLWQEVRWISADPLAIAFRDHSIEKDGNEVYGAEIRKFINTDILKAEEQAEAAGFDCKALAFANSLAVCYRDVWTRLCKDIWNLQMVFDNKKKIIQANGRKKRVCLFQ